MQIPKEKAQELYDKYYAIIQGADMYAYLLSSEEVSYSKQCALIAVDEILEYGVHTANWDIGEPYKSQSSKEYWEEVKKEIINL